jgi:hypothetical protein
VTSERAAFLDLLHAVVELEESTRKLTLPVRGAAFAFCSGTFRGVERGTWPATAAIVIRAWSPDRPERREEDV